MKNVLIISALYLFLLKKKKLHKPVLYLQKGTLAGVGPISLLFTAITILSLTVWFVSRTDNPYAELVPDRRLLWLIPGGLAFAAINACYEEGLFRSILMSRFAEEIGFTSAAILQAWWFSCLHFQVGFPSGFIGMGLTFVFGLMMAYLVGRTNGLLLPVVIHFLADVTVVSLVVLRMGGVV